MNCFRSSIETFFAFLLSAGLLISTFHIHEILDLNHAAQEVNTWHELNQDHNQCPICAVVYKADFNNNVTFAPNLFLSDSISGLSDQVTSTPVHSSRDGRSPPPAA